ncbi:FUSC family protein [Methylobacterium mesophilicum SR1.6/6]|uniref:FUSC family protein n=1 Tax=Methylobacterium mesophilicum SR1.6/6 TaxID=908290 RepID=A0A6B9FNM0_9HYPH|nr:FUSC family protein [Methylobacterium mesophilicum]QGY03602.1 FUSC family protein [Methylobacterium mesophilicum SR1.6/6]
MNAMTIHNSRASFRFSIASAWPFLLHGFRVAASVLAALAVSYNLALDNGFWSGITAAVACLPSLGTSLQKGRVRIAGTFVGAVSIVAITAMFPQNCFALFVSVALWCGLCGFVASLLRNFGSYGAALAGFTAVVIFTGIFDDPNHAFILAMTRALEISIGVASAAAILVVTDTGGARERLATAFADIASAVSIHLDLRLQTQAMDSDAAAALVKRVVALDSRLDEAFGEEPDLRRRFDVLHAGIEGLFSALAAAEDISNLGTSPSRNPTDILVACSTWQPWLDDPAGLRARFADEARDVEGHPASSPAELAVADRTVAALTGLAKAANGLTVIVGDRGEPATRVGGRFLVPDVLPALVDGFRAVLAVLAAEVFWVATNWSGGQACVTFTIVSVTVFSPLRHRAVSTAFDYCLGTAAAFVLALLVNFALLPGLDGFPAFSLALSCLLVPLGGLSATRWRKGLTAALLINFLAILSPTNPPVYDPIQFLNSGLAVVAGAVFGVLAMLLVPSLSTTTRAHRLVALSLRDMRRLAVRRRWMSRADWISLISCRLEALPVSASLEQRSSLLMAMSVGGAIIDLRQLGDRPGRFEHLDRGLAEIGAGHSASARYWLGQFAGATDPNERLSGSMLQRRASAELIAGALA